MVDISIVNGTISQLITGGAPPRKVGEYRGFPGTCSHATLSRQASAELGEAMKT
jgi:hypothetical protein